MMWVLFILGIVGANILPFTSVKMMDDDIYVSIDNNRTEWHKLLSINNIGSDALVNFSKEHYGMSKCDYEIECYKYNIIINFDEVFAKLNGKEMAKFVTLELDEETYQNGVDVEANSLKYDICKNNEANNIQLSKKKNKLRIFGKQANTLFKGIGNTISNIFNNEGSDETIKIELDEIKKEIENIEKNEIAREKVNFIYKGPDE